MCISNVQKWKSTYQYVKEVIIFGFRQKDKISICIS